MSRAGDHCCKEPNHRGDPEGEVGDGNPVVVVYTLAQAIGALKAAARAGQPVRLLSAANAGVCAGVGWFSALVDAARAAVPAARCTALLDCGDQPGAVLAAIRIGVEAVIFAGRADVARRLGEIAARHGVGFRRTRPAADLDLIDDFFASEDESAQHCAALLERLQRSR